MNGNKMNSIWASNEQCERYRLKHWVRTLWKKKKKIRDRMILARKLKHKYFSGAIDEVI